MGRPLHPNYEAAFRVLGESLKLAVEAYEGGTTGTITDNLVKAVVALDDCYSFDEQESPFTLARPIIETGLK